MNTVSAVSVAELNRLATTNKPPNTIADQSALGSNDNMPGGALKAEEVSGQVVERGDASATSIGSLSEQSLTSTEHLAREPSALQKLSAEPTTTERLAIASGLEFIK